MTEPDKPEPESESAESADEPEPDEHEHDYKREVLAGLTTFLTMSYIAVLNPQILSDGTGLAFGALVTATVLAAAAGSICMGLIARLPYALAPGMGLNAFFTFELVKKYEVSGQVALGLVVWSGILFMILSATPLRREVAKAIPIHLREAISGGIGIFLAFIGLMNTQIVVPHPKHLVTMGDPGLQHLLFLVGLFVAFGLHRRKKPYAFIAAIGASTALAFMFERPESVPEWGWVALPDKGWVTAPDLGLLFDFDLVGALSVSLLAPMLTLMFTDLFDSLSTFLGVAQAADLLDENGEPIRIERALLVDAGATLTSGLFGTSPATTYIESTAGIEAGGRTGLTAIVAGVLFLPLAFFSPLLAMIPLFATAPILVIVGALMAKGATKLGSRPLEERLPAFFVLILIPLTFSITSGILWGLVLHPLMYLLAGRAGEVRTMMWALFVVAAGLLGLEAFS